MNDNEVFAMPRDSSDEENHINASKNAKAAPEPATVSSKPPRRKKEPPKPTRTSKRPKLQDQPDLLHTKPEEEKSASNEAGLTSQSLEWDLFGSQGASQKRSQNKFKRKYERPPPAGFTSELGGFRAPHVMPEKTTGLEKPDAPKKSIPELPTEQTVNSRRTFKIFEMPSVVPVSSGVSQDTSPPDDAGLSSPSQRPPRSDSSPPSTPVSTMRDRGASDCEDGSPQKSNICPVCQKEVVRSRLVNPGMDIREVHTFPFRKQRAFCLEHSRADAEVFSTENGYPEIDWKLLRTQRIPALKDFLKEIITRRRKSHYFEELDAQIADKRNRKQIREYLAKQRNSTELVPTGYYGAKGAQIIAEVITRELSRYISSRATNEAIMAVGVGPFVSTVLVPELTTKLIMEDMNVHDEAKARAIMQESAHAGMFLHPEDEKVERRDED
ncbi:uncharacterized protein HMPREF1541_08080 [Cyphellophora europaea CBS 101466]|uniref:Restriction of telomere capping protein 4 n=1 Tax=Cyphellophora europaea (strain CBS 101466) TaxID=1220924 RepID=W2RL90_CYPE1|nr:uncharacterized protein HMPREF1541_08080 [Cyphellophora europaea CBS 101466]ETN37090.1 hypothetical protein HMPREF1541_08080 [Cyphellophora europaea CBS 101466]